MCASGNDPCYFINFGFRRRGSTAIMEVLRVEEKVMNSTLRVASMADAEEIANLVNRAYRPSPCERGWTHEADLIESTRCSHSPRKN